MWRGGICIEAMRIGTRVVQNYMPITKNPLFCHYTIPLVVNTS